MTTHLIKPSSPKPPAVSVLFDVGHLQLQFVIDI